jgi:hypothetical protein
MAAKDKPELEDRGYIVKGLPEESRCFFEDTEPRGFFNFSLTSDDFLDARLQDTPFSELGDQFQDYVLSTPQFLMYADQPAIYPMVTMRQLEYETNHG